jgi:hypothetical protein
MEDGIMVERTPRPGHRRLQAYVDGRWNYGTSALLSQLLIFSGISLSCWAGPILYWADQSRSWFL